MHQCCSEKMSQEKSEGIAGMNGLAPIVLGVTGHRDVPADDVAALEAATHSALREISGLTPNSPRLLISCLAEGADRIAARCALESNWALGVVLPAPVDVYERDFSTDSSRKEFRALLASAAWVECVSANPSGKPDYPGAGIRVMQQSQLLLAYWDGRYIGLDGGTSYIVDKFLTEIPDSGYGISGNTPPDARPVIHVMTRRQASPDDVKVGQVGKCQWLAPCPGGMSGEGEIERWREVLRRMDHFNADASRLLACNSAAVEASRKYLDGQEISIGLPERINADGSGHMFAVADALSLIAQKERDQAFARLSGLAVMAIVLEQVYSSMITDPLILGLAVLSGIVAVLVYKKGARRRIEERYLDYRSLAEACRVQYFWQLAGIRASVADNFLLEQRDELEWVRQALRTNELAFDVGRAPSPDGAQRFRDISAMWLKGQCHYFVGLSDKGGGNKAEHNKMSSAKWSRRAAALFMTAVAVVILQVFASVFLFDGNNAHDAIIVQYSSVLYGLLFAAAGLIKVFQEVKAFSEQGKSYRRSGMLMQRALQRLDTAIRNEDIQFAQRVIYETGCEALDENGDWLLLHRDRPVEVPLG